jgi:hypothetical protein
MVRGEVIHLVSYWDQSHERLHARHFATASADDGGYAAAQTRAAYAGRLHPRCAQAGGLFATSAGYRNCRGSACAQAQIAYNSCRNRHCPKCQGRAAQRWLEARQADLLPVEYYHVVFSLPAPISAIAYTNKEIMYGLLFGIAAETLRTIAADPKHLGANHLYMRRLKLVEDGILVRDAGTHRIDHVHTDDNVLRVHRAGQERDKSQKKPFETETHRALGLTIVSV